MSTEGKSEPVGHAFKGEGLNHYRYEKRKHLRKKEKRVRETKENVNDHNFR